MLRYDPSKIATVHQSISIAIAAATGLQSFLSWRQHVRFLHIGHRIWLHDSRFPLGGLVMVVQRSDAVLGMILLCGYSIKAIVVAGLL